VFDFKRNTHCFARFDRARHVKAVEIIPDLLTFRAIDFGYRASACLWAQRSPTRQLFLIDELLPANLTTPELVAAIKVRKASFGLSVPPRASYCDPGGQRTGRAE